MVEDVPALVNLAALNEGVLPEHCLHGLAKARTTPHRYQIDFDALDVQSLRELIRLIRDLDHEKQAAVNRARMMPWRR